MISFDKVNQFDRLYHVLNYYFAFAHDKIYYRKIRVVGRENIPAKGHPTLVIANHQNALMDALAILYLFENKRQPVFIARGDIFKKSDVIAKLLRFLKILPTFRSRDGGRADIRSNLDTFDLAAGFLNEGATVCIFPEAKHQPGKFFSTFKKGYPRLAFRSAELSDYQNDLKILPIYIYYTNYFHMGYEQVLVVGEPFGLESFYEQYKSEPNKALLALNDRSKATIQSLGVDVTDEEHYEQYEVAFEVCRTAMMAQQRSDPADPYSALCSDKAVLARLDALRETHPEQFEAFVTMATDYKEGMHRLNLRTWQLEREFTMLQLCGRWFALLLTFPLFLFGFVNNLVPFYASKLLTKNLKDKMFSSTLNFALGAIITYPIWTILTLVVGTSLFHNFGFALLYLLMVLLTMFVQYGWRKLWIKTVSLCRYYRFIKRGDALLQKVKSLRQEILRILSL